MNARIRQIAEDCGLYIAYDNRQVTDAELEFFAQQIVQECVNKLETYQIPVGNSAAGELACTWTYDALREIRDDIREVFKAN